MAKELVRFGAKRVQTCDLFADAAQIDGCTYVENWAESKCDFLVPCANSLAITEEVATNFHQDIKYCVGATNSPFASQEARDIFDKRGVMHIPESISSAGAILADSVEVRLMNVHFSHFKFCRTAWNSLKYGRFLHNQWYDIDLYQSVEPSKMYGWIRDISRQKAATLASHADQEPQQVTPNLHNVVPDRDGSPVGKDFLSWIEEHSSSTETLIIGGGLAGTATAFSLSEKGIKSCLVEQGSSVAPSTASSNGDSRMYRKMYSSEFCKCRPQ